MSSVPGPASGPPTSESTAAELPPSTAELPPSPELPRSPELPPSPEPPPSPGPHPPPTLTYEPPATPPPPDPASVPAPLVGAGRGRGRRALPLLVVLAAAVTAVLALWIVAPPSGTGTTPAGFALPPTAPAQSPTSLPADTPWPGTVPPPSPTGAAGTTPSDAAASTGSDLTSGVPTGSASTGGDAAARRGSDGFCRVAGSALSAVGEHGASALRALATGSGDAAPQARALVESALTGMTELRKATPQALTGAVGALDRAWSGLASDLARHGYDRTSVVVLSFKYLADPAVASAADTLGRWVADGCGPAPASQQ